MQEGKTRWFHYSITYHFVWIPKYRRKITTEEVQRATKELIQACCECHALTLLALETHLDHIHICVSAPPHFSPAQIANLLKGYSAWYVRLRFPHLGKCGAKIMCGHKPTMSQALELSRMKSSGAPLRSLRASSTRERRRFHLNPLKGMGIPALLL